MKWLSYLVILLLSGLQESPAQSTQWKRLNGPYGSPTRAMACDSSNTLYAAVDDSLYRSEDGGSHWERIGNEFKNCLLQEVAVGNDGTVYLAACNGLYTSTDRGESWAKLPFLYYAKEVQTSENGLVCAIGTDDNTVELGLFISRDSGKTWEQPIVDLPGGFDYEYLLSTGPKGEIYTIAKGSLPVTPLKLFRSFDKGRSWDTLNVEGLITPDSVTKSYFARGARSRLTTDYSGRLYCTFEVNSGSAYPFTSIDKGKTWSLSHDFDKGDSLLPGFYHYMAGRNGDIYGFDANGSGFFMVCREKSGALVRFQDPYAFIYTTLVDRSGKVFIATETGIYYYDPELKLVGAGTNNAKVWRILTDRNGNLIASVYRRTSMRGFNWYHEGYLTYSTDQGLTWSSYGAFKNPSQAFVSDIAMDSSGRTIIAAPEWRSFYYFDPAAHLLTAFPGPGITVDSGLVAIGSTGTIYKTTGYVKSDIQVSANNGLTWQQISNGLEQRIYSICTSVNGFVFVGTANAAYRLKEGDTVWTRCYNQFLGSPVIALHTTPNGIVYAGSSAQGIYTSSDNGDTWKQINSGLTNTTVSTICSDLQGNIYTATKGGVFRSSSTSDWENISAGIDALDIRDLTISTKGILYAATHGGGVYQFLPNVNSVGLQERSYTINVRIAENPFRDEAVLHIQSESFLSLQLDIHDALGRKRLSKNLEHMDNRRHSYSIKTGGWAAGVYYGRIITSEGQVLTIRLIKQ